MNLKDEILAGESATLEFKRCPNENADRWLKTVVAFANGKGGRILFGVDNDQTVVGVGNEAFAEYGVRPVELEDTGLSTRMTVGRNKKANGGNREVVNTTSTHREGVNTTSASDNEVVNTTSAKHEAVFTHKAAKDVCDAVLAEVAAHPRIRKPALIAAIKVSRATIERVLARLQREGKVEFRGAPKNGGYYCK